MAASILLYSSFSLGQSGIPLSSWGTGISTSLVPGCFTQAERVRLAFVMERAKLTRVGGTSKSSKEPDILSLPPIAGSPIPIWAESAPNSAAAGWPQREGTACSRGKYSWKVSRAFNGSAPTAKSFERLSTTA